MRLLPDNPHLKFVVPDEGCMLWTNNMMIPEHREVTPTTRTCG